MRVILLFISLALIEVAAAQGPEWVFGDGPFSGGAIIAQQSNGHIFSTRNGYLIYSWDNGRNWHVRSHEPIFPREIRVIDDESLLAINGEGVLRSDTNRITWYSAGLESFWMECRDKRRFTIAGRPLCGRRG